MTSNYQTNRFGWFWGSGLSIVVLILFVFALAEIAGAQIVSSVPYTSGEGGYHTYRIPALVISDQGTVLAFCEGRKRSMDDAGDIDLLLRRSLDSGETWQPVQIVHEEGGTREITIGNPCPVVEREDGVIHLLFTRNNQKMFHTSSRDDGGSWSDPKEITSVIQEFEFPANRMGAGPGHGIQLRNPDHAGRLLMPIWLNERIGYNYRAAVVYSDDQGQTWKKGGLIGPEIEDTNECMAVELANGDILLNMRAREQKKRSISLSHDGGMSWTTPQFDETLICPTCQASIVGCNNLQDILFLNPASLKREMLTLRLSRDAGENWCTLNVIHEGPAAYSDMAVVDGNDVACLFECGKQSPYETIGFSRFGLQAASK